MAVEIKNWANLNEEDRQVIIIKTAYEYDLGFKLSYNIPSIYDTENGYFDSDENIFYFNYGIMKDDSSLNVMYNFFFELRKVMQIKKLVDSPIIQRALEYTINYDGSVYKKSEGIQSVEVPDPDEEGRKYFKQVYVSCPNVYDCNKFAYEKMLEYVKDVPELVEELNSIYEYWKPTFEFFSEDEIEAKYTEIFDYVDQNL